MCGELLASRRRGLDSTKPTEDGERKREGGGEGWGEGEGQGVATTTKEVST